MTCEMSLFSCIKTRSRSPVDDSTTNCSGSEYDDDFTCVAIHGDSRSLKFTNEDVAFCVGVDKLYHRDFVSREERFRGENQIAPDARSMREAFISKLNLHDDKVNVSIASNSADDCTKQGLRASFLNIATLAKSNGNFIFYFAGHGFRVNGKYVIAPSDYADGTESAGILGDDLVQWLNEADCKAKNVLFIFDCCYAGNLGESLKKYTKLKKPAYRLFAMCGCGSGEIISSVGALGHSIFTYFLLDHLKTSELNIAEAAPNIQKLCVSLSSLVIMYDNEKGKPYPGKFTPKLLALGIVERIILPKPEEKEVVALLTRLLPKTVSEQPHACAINWLRSSPVKDALLNLSDKAYYRDKLQTGIVSALLHSLAIIHYAYANEDGRKLLKSRNLFLVVAIIVSKEISFCELTIKQIMTGLKHYIYVVEKFKIDSSYLHDLHTEMDVLRNRPVSDDNQLEP